MKWLKVASLSVLGVVLLVFALMGLMYATRGTPPQTVRAFGDPAGPPAADDSTFVRTIELLTGTQLYHGNSIEILENGNGVYPRLYADMHNAQRSLSVQLYYAKPGLVADSFKAILSERARAGVHVLFLLDAFGAESLTDGYLDSIRATGAHVAMFRSLNWRSLHKTQNRSHVRAIIIDETVSYTGGFGLADYWLGDGRHEEQWRDSNVRFTGPAVLQAQAAFAIAWAEATGELLTGRFFFGTQLPSAGDSGQLAGLFHAMPTIGSTSSDRFIALSIAGAKHSLYITNAYFLPDADQRRLLELAVKRGVDVRVLTAGKKTDIKSVRFASHASYEELLRAGVRIYEYQPSMLHAKSMVVDGIWGTVGTMNFDNRSIAFNDEANLIVRDSAFGQTLQTHFFDDLRLSQEFKLATFQRRSVFEKLLDWGASQFAKIL